MRKENRTANQGEMIVNQQGYSNGKEAIEINEKNEVSYIEKK